MELPGHAGPGSKLRLVAPSYVVPADRSWDLDLVVSEVQVEALAGLHIRLPEGDPGMHGLQVT